MTNSLGSMNIRTFAQETAGYQHQKGNLYG